MGVGGTVKKDVIVVFELRWEYAVIRRRRIVGKRVFNRPLAHRAAVLFAIVFGVPA